MADDDKNPWKVVTEFGGGGLRAKGESAEIRAECTDSQIRLKGPGYLELYSAESPEGGTVLELTREQAERARELLDEWLGGVTRRTT